MVVNHSQMGHLSLITLQAGKQGTPYSRHFLRVGGRNPRSRRSPGTPGPALALPPCRAHPAAAPRLSGRLTLDRTAPGPRSLVLNETAWPHRSHHPSPPRPAPTNGHCPIERARAADQRPQPQLRLKVKKKKKSGQFFKPKWRGNTGSHTEAVGT